ncbi:MAG: cytochrome C [Acidobacteria bacterium]|nr:cytochrome C [Acidobacteriota bacterium]
MKTLRVSVALFGAALLVLAYSGTPEAFHSGGVAECGGCHSMHSPAPAGTFLLVKNDASSTCLNCHEGSAGSYRVSTAPGSLGAGQAPIQRGPGGDFGWLKKDYTFTIRGTTSTEFGYTHGHNIVAADYGYLADPVKTTSPGGDFTSANLSCVTCHDPHGQYRRLFSGNVSTTGGPIKGSGSFPGGEPDANNAVGVYHLLAGAGYSRAPFPGVPAAKAPSTYNRSEASTQTRVAYGRATTTGHTTWGNWCGTCHTDMHSSGSYVHPVDQNLSSATRLNYERYVKTGDMTGSAATSFTSLVPFVTNSGDYAGVLSTLAVNNNSQLGGPAGSDQVTCLSCHRSHASGFRNALRWNGDSDFLTYSGNYPGTDTTPTLPQYALGRTSAETQAAYYDRPPSTFASYQRSLCNKCHAKD